MTLEAPRPGPRFINGMTLIELVIVVAIVAILLTLAVPNYRSYTLRVHRSEAIRMLLQASICQERVHARLGSYDTGQCRTTSGQQRYRLSYKQPGMVGQSYVVMATPVGSQHADPCGSLSLSQSGEKGISNTNVSVMKCWNGR